MLVVHPNNPTGSYVKPHEAEELNRICAGNGIAIIADEVFLDYSLGAEPLTFSSNRDALTFTLSGLSKISGLPQMKVAWIAVSGPEALKAEALAPPGGHRRYLSFDERSRAVGRSRRCWRSGMESSGN